LSQHIGDVDGKIALHASRRNRTLAGTPAMWPLLNARRRVDDRIDWSAVANDRFLVDATA
jgi:hypothetical protein